MPSPTNLSHHELAVLAKASEQVNIVCEREWIAKRHENNCDCGRRKVAGAIACSTCYAEARERC
jgi:hypothetical protein